MEPWKDYIGDGSGVFCMFDATQVDGTIYTAPYLALLTAKSEEAYAGMGAEVAEAQGIFVNAATSQFWLMSQVKQNVLRIDTLEYVFNKQFYYNPTYAQGEVLGLVKAGNISDFINDPDTIKLTVLNGSDFLAILL
jgi:hypothetical protein